MNKKIIFSFLIILMFSVSTFFIYATETDNENPTDATTESQTNEASDSAGVSTDAITYTPQTYSGSNSSYVTSVTPVSSQYEANLGLNNILSILLISIGILLILFSIAILIRIKR